MRFLRKEKMNGGGDVDGAVGDESLVFEWGCRMSSMVPIVEEDV